MYKNKIFFLYSPEKTHDSFFIKILYFDKSLSKVSVKSIFYLLNFNPDASSFNLKLSKQRFLINCFFPTDARLIHILSLRIKFTEYRIRKIKTAKENL